MQLDLLALSRQLNIAFVAGAAFLFA